MDQKVEQPAQADSADPMDTLLDRVTGAEPENQQDAPEQGEEQVSEQPDQDASPEVETQEALEEVEWEGEKYQLPPKLKSALMRQQDYTQKTQAVAERERMVALNQQRLQLESEFQQSVQQEQIQLYQLEAAIGQYENVNWPALDVEAYIKTKHQLDSLKEKRDELRKGIEGKRQEFEKKAHEVLRDSLTKANEILSRSIPKWGPEVQKELMSYGQGEGYTDVELGSIRDPRIIRTLWKAQQWDKLQAAKPLATKRATGVPPVIKPGAAKPAPSAQAVTAAAIKELHQAKDPQRKKALFDKAMDLKLSRMLK